MFLSRVVAFSRLVRSIVRTPGIGGLRENLRSQKQTSRAQQPTARAPSCLSEGPRNAGRSVRRLGTVCSNVPLFRAAVLACNRRNALIPNSDNFWPAAGVLCLLWRPREAAPRAGCARQGDAAQADERITLDALGPLCSVASVYTVEDV